MADFVHLHVHTDHSLLDGAIRIKDLVKRTQEFGLPAVAVTDHGNMFGAVELYMACKEAALNPLLGCEFYLAPGRRDERNPATPHIKGYHLVLFAENDAGYRNLCHLQARAWLEGRYYNPRIDKELLRQYQEGLICMTACIGGELPRRIVEGREEDVQRTLGEYLDIFGRDRLFLEMQNHGAKFPEEVQVNRKMVELSRQHGLKLVATNDAHYLKREHAKAHEVLLCIGTQTTMQDPKRMNFGCDEFYLKSPEEMAELFKEVPEACTNTLILHERCHVTLDFKTNHYPKYTPADLTGRETPDEVEEKRAACFRAICVQGLKTRYDIDMANPESLRPEDREKLDRMEFEIGVIRTMGFVSYYLVVWDFIHAAKQQGIPVGPGRGSGAGSLAAYLMGITDVDPLRYGLLFERFLNPDRVSPPDFDIDFCERRRHEVIEYVKKKYGDASVSQIITYGTLKAKAVLKDVARALGRTPAEGNLLSKFIPEDPKMTLGGALGEDPKHPEWTSKELKDLLTSEPWAREVMEYARVLEGLTRGTGIHAAGVIIGDQPLEDIVPLSKAPSEETTTQYAAPICEKLGLLKMDFLGLKTLTIIQDALDNIVLSRGEKIDLAKIPLDDQPTFDLLSRGDTIAVFQLESSGFQETCTRMGVDRFEDISALLAIYRPGPMAFIPEYCDRKAGRMRIEYDHPDMKPVLEETCGIMLYQEQIMQVVQRLAGFSLGQADILRRAMGKKKKEEMDTMFAKFVEGCASFKDIPKATAEIIWEKIKKFADYGFNKSHSTAYGMLTYQTAWLKTHYKVEFMAAMLTSELGNSEKLAFYLQATRDMGIAVLPPDVSVSGRTFTVDKDKIRFGLAAIKGVGEGAADAIAEARRAGPFKDFQDFCERAGDKINRRVLESLCKAGAFDGFGLRRAQLFAMLDEALTHAQQKVSDRLRGQGSLFDFLGADAAGGDSVAVPNLPEWSDRERLGYEKELLGVFVSGHPLQEHARMLAAFQTVGYDQLEKFKNKIDQETPVSVRMGGLLSSIQIKASKRDGRKFAITLLEGLNGSIECLAFADAFEKYQALLVPDQFVFVEGVFGSRDDGSAKLLADRILPALEVPGEWTAELQVRIRQQACTDAMLERLLHLCRDNPGTTPLVLCLICEDRKLAFLQPEKLLVRNTPAFRQGVLDLFGPDGLMEKATKPAERRPRGNYARNGNGGGGGR